MWHPSDRLFKVTADQPATGMPSEEDLPPCPYCGHPSYAALPETGRTQRAECVQCGGVVYAVPGGQWQPELIGDPANHPSPHADPASGGVGGAANATVMEARPVKQMNDADHTAMLYRGSFDDYEIRSFAGPRSLKPVRDSLKAQGISDDHPIHGVLGHGDTTHVAFHAPTGQVAGAIAHYTSKSPGVREQYINQLRTLHDHRGHGVGEQLVRAVAQDTLNHHKSHEYEMKVGSLNSAMSFYSKLGADFQPHYHNGHWSPEKVQQLAHGEDPEPGKYWTAHSNPDTQEWEIHVHHPDGSHTVQNPTQSMSGYGNIVGAPESGQHTAGYDEYGEWDGQDDDDEVEAKSVDWDERHPHIHEMHRGIGVMLPDELHHYVHDRSKPLADRAHALLNHVGNGNHITEGLGLHWTDNENVGHDFAQQDAKRKAGDDKRQRIEHKDFSWGHEPDDEEIPHGKPATHIVLHSDQPPRESINHDFDPNGYGSGAIYDHDEHGESEIPINHGGEIPIKGITFKQHKTIDDETPEDWDDEGEHHEFGETQHHTASWDDDEDEGEECEHCGHPLEDPDHGEAHEDWRREQPWHTDWEDVEHIGGEKNELHRGMAMSLPPHVHNVVHDEERPMHERAQALTDHIIQSDKGHLGRFWSDEQGVSRDYATVTRVHRSDQHNDRGLKTPVVIHAEVPSREHIETDPDELTHHTVYSYHLPNNREVPLQHGTPMTLKGISWSHPRDEYDSTSSPHPNSRDEYPDKGTDDHLWSRHDFQGGIKATSSHVVAAHDLNELMTQFGYDHTTGKQLPDREDTTTPTRRLGFAGYIEGHRMTHSNHGYDLGPDWEDEQPTGFNSAVHYFHHVSGRENNYEAWHKHGEVQPVPLHEGDVYATQGYVRDHGVAQYLKEPEQKWRKIQGRPGYPGNDHPLFVKHQDNYYTLDGHHRTSAAMLRGDSHITARLYDADKHGIPQAQENYTDYDRNGTLNKYAASAVGCMSTFDSPREARDHEIRHHDDGICLARSGMSFTGSFDAWMRTAMPSSKHSVPTDLTFSDTKPGWNREWMDEARPETDGWSHHELQAHFPEHEQKYPLSSPTGTIFYSHHPDTNTVAVQDMNVHPEYRSHGIASAMQDKLHQQYPGHFIDHGNRTDDGHEWAKQYRAPEGHTAAHSSLSWDEIADRHPHVYGDADIHGDAADGADGPGIGDAANYLAHERAEDPDAENSSVHDLDFHEETVHPRHIDYSPSGSDDYRVRHAREGYQQHPDQMPPLVLVHRHGVYQVADGHHRAEAADSLDQPVKAYVAHSPYPDEPFRDGDKGPFHGAEPTPRLATHSGLEQHTAQVWYHGAPREFDDLRAPDRSDMTPGAYADHHWNTDLGVHFSDDPQVAHSYAGEDGSVAHAHLPMRNPARYSSENEMTDHVIDWAKNNNLYFGPTSDAAITAIDHGNHRQHELYDKNNWLDQHPHRLDITQGYKNALQTQGYDGVIHHHPEESPVFVPQAAIPFGDHNVTHWQSHTSALNDEVPWCAHLYHGNCTYPGDKLPNGTILGIPQDRGPCPWKKSSFQQAACPISAPGPMAIMSLSALQASAKHGDSTDYTVSHVEPSEDNLHQHVLVLHHPDESATDLYGPEDQFHHYAGHIKWDADGIHKGLINEVNIKPSHQRKGLATKLLQTAKAMDQDVHHGDLMTPEGAVWAASEKGSAYDEQGSQRAGSLGAPGTVASKAFLSRSGQRDQQGSEGTGRATHAGLNEGDLSRRWGVPLIQGNENRRGLEDKLAQHYGLFGQTPHRNLTPNDRDLLALVHTHHEKHGIPRLIDNVGLPGNAQARAVTQLTMDARDAHGGSKVPSMSIGHMPGNEPKIRAGRGFIKAGYHSDLHHIQVDPHTFGLTKFEGGEERGWHTPRGHSTELDHAISHEFGHSRDLTMPQDQRSAMLQAVSHHIPGATPYQPGQDPAAWHRHNLEHVLNHVSLYGGQSHLEMIAELHAEHRHSLNPSMAAQVAGRHLEGRGDEYEDSSGHLGRRHQESYGGGIAMTAEEDESYRMSHQPPDSDYGAPFHALAGEDGKGGLFPADIYTHPQYYDTGHADYYNVHNQIRKAQGSPEKKIRIYRALPAAAVHHGFQSGNWVSTSKEYARDHGRNSDPHHDWPVISTTVPAKHLHSEGDLMEWGYNGPPKTEYNNVSFKGGHHQEVSAREDGSIRPVQRRENPLKGYSFQHYLNDANTDNAHHHVIAYDGNESYVGHLKQDTAGKTLESHVEPEHAHLPLEERMKKEISKHRTAAKIQPELHWHFTASWSDVRQKAKRLRAEGNVTITVASHDGIGGEVQGDHGLYETILNFVPGSSRVGAWNCGCEWATYAFDRSPAFKRFEGRMCSHALAMNYEAQSQGMFGKTVTPTKKRRAAVDYDFDGVYAEGHGLDLVHPPIYAIALNMVENQDEPADIVRRLASLGLDHRLAQDLTKEALGLPVIAKDATPPADNPDHPQALQLTQDTRGHATDFGEGVPDWGVGKMEWCPQCGGIGCGHDGGTGQVIETGGITANPISDQNQDAGDAIREDGLNVSGAAHRAQKQHQGAKDPDDAVGSLNESSLDEVQHAALHHLDSLPEKITGQHLHDLYSAHNIIPHASSPQVDMEDNFPPDREMRPVSADEPLHTSQDFLIKKTLADHIRNPYKYSPSDYDPTTHDDRVWTLRHRGMTWIGEGHHRIMADRMTYRRGIPAGHRDLDEEYGPDFNAETHYGSLEDGLSIGDAAPFETGPSVAGVALKAADTGRVLMLQRGLDDEDDPAAGTWEFPGGHLEKGDQTSLHGGIREWEEEVGQRFPEGGTVYHTWTSPNGIYQGHLVVIPEEKQVILHGGRLMPNPDDPHGDMAEQAAWWQVDHAKKNPALRPELKTGTPWGKLQSAGEDLQKAADYAANDPFSGVETQTPINPPQHSNTSDPASTGFATSVDPDGWDGEAPFGNRDDAPMAAYEATLHDTPEPALPSTDGELEPVHDEGQWGHLPNDIPHSPYTGDSDENEGEINSIEDSLQPNSVTASVDDIVTRFQRTAGGSSLGSGGSSAGPSDGDIAKAAREHLQKSALKDFTFSEQQELINEGLHEKRRARNMGDLKIEGTHYEALQDALDHEVDPDDIFV